MAAPFLGFPDTQAFLRELRANNDRDWFNANKARGSTRRRPRRSWPWLTDVLEEH